MYTKTYPNNDTIYYIANDGKTLAMYRPERQERKEEYSVISQRTGEKITRTRLIKGCRETIYINSNIQCWTTAFRGASDLQRVKAEYKDDICEIVSKYPNAIISCYSTI